jgi:hypothetical protein
MKNAVVKFLIWISTFSIIIFAVMYICKFNSGLSNASLDWGSFGSYSAGTIGICLSLLSVIFLYLTFREQRRQKFENAFQQYVASYYSMLLLIKENWLHRDSLPEYLNGREIFGRAVTLLQTEKPKASFDYIFNLHINVFQHYCNYIIELFEMVSKFKDLENEEQMQYINRFLSMLSTFELIFFSYFILFKSDSEHNSTIKICLYLRLSKISIGNALPTHTSQIIFIINEYKKYVEANSTKTSFS